MLTPGLAYFHSAAHRGHFQLRSLISGLQQLAMNLKVIRGQ